MASSKYKILYIGKFGKNNTETHVANSLEKAGNEVHRVWFDGEIDAVINDSHLFDFVLFAKLPDHWKYLISKVKTKKVCWAFDLYPFGARTLEAPELKADVVISTGGVPNTPIVRQGIPKEHKYIVKPNYKYDVAFVGTLHTDYRLRLHQYLMKTYGERYLRIGDDNDIRGEALNEKLSEIKVVVRDSVPSENYWSNGIYEVTGRGGFCLHPYVKGFEELKHVVTFKRDSQEDLKNKIDYYVDNDKERLELLSKAHKSCPTYDDRIKELLCLL